MTGEILNLLEKVEKFINDFELGKKGNIIVGAALFCILFIHLIGAINTATVEEIFMDEKRKKRNSFFKLLMLLIIFIPTNFVLSIQGKFILFEILLGIICIIVCIIYSIKEHCTTKYIESISELNAYYKEKRLEYLLASIVCLMPSVDILMYHRVDNISLFSCIVIVSVSEVFAICFSMPEFVNRSANNFFIDNDNKLFIYKKIDNDTIMCGDNMEISQANKYITITYEELKKKEIIHMQYKCLSRTEKKKFRNKYKENRASIKNKSKILNKQSEYIINSK